MARKIQSRLRIAGTFTALTPLHIGGNGDSPDTDLPLARNGEDKWYVPGTSLAGVLRAWCIKAFGKAEAEAIWGPQMEKQNSDKGHASFVLIEDAVVELPEGAIVEIRDGVGIDRAWGAAAEGIKYDQAVLPRGSKLPLKMTVEIADKRCGDPRSEDEELRKDETDEKFDQRVKRTKAIIGHLLDALSRKEIALGAARTRGLGRVAFQLNEEKALCQTFNKWDGILQVLEGNGEPISILEMIGADKDINPCPRLEVVINWYACSALMVKAGYDGIGVDMLPLVSAKNHGVALALPGSSIKGALRNHAERIVRTLLEREMPRDAGDRQNFMKQIELPLIDELFGARGQRQKKHKGLGALSVADCYAEEAMDRKDWQAIEIAAAPDATDEEPKLRQVIDKLNQRLHQIKFAITHHVAIDRWTGGAAEGALFSTLTPTPTTAEASASRAWEAITLTIDFNRLPEDLRLPAVMLLLLVLRDLASERLPLGFATNRGLGELAVDRIWLQGSGFGDEEVLKNLSGIELPDGKMVGLDEELRHKLKTAWESWINKEKAA